MVDLILTEKGVFSLVYLSPFVQPDWIQNNSQKGFILGT